MAISAQKLSIRMPLLIIGIVEAAILATSTYFGALLKFGSFDALAAIEGQLVLNSALFTVIMFMSLIAMGLYQFHQRLRFDESAIRVIVALIAGTIALSALLYVMPSMRIGRLMTVYALGYSLLLILLARLIFVRTVDDNIFRRRVLIYGAGDNSTFISRLRRRADRRGFKIVGNVRAQGDNNHEGRDAADLNGKTITQLALELQADEIVIAMDERRGNLPTRALLDARLHGIDVIDLVDFLERESGKIQVDLANPGWLIFSEGFQVSRYRKFSKRLLDLVFSGILFVVGAPVMVAVAIAVKLEDGLRAPVLYRQRRVGQSGTLFWVLKFRSMQVDAEPDGRAVWAEHNDPRVTKVGNFIRKFRIDELPQVFNVLLGSMSLVGPRPERPEFVSELQEKVPYYSERLAVKPGVTGWAQLKYSYGSSDEDALEKLQYDLYYVKNHSLLLDIMIILQTVEVVIWGKGAR
jgi:sugar transferase (PEP-CTERM system associated)